MSQGRAWRIVRSPNVRAVSLPRWVAITSDQYVVKADVGTDWPSL